MENYRMESNKKKKPIIVYVDGMSLSFGIKDKGWGRYSWIDFEKLSNNFRNYSQQIVSIKYFTSHNSIHWFNQSKQQATAYLQKIEGIDLYSVYYRNFGGEIKSCLNIIDPDIGFVVKPSTDINLAIQLMIDAFSDSFDTAIIVSGDNGFSGLIQNIKELYPEKEIKIAFLQNRMPRKLISLADKHYIVGRKMLSESQFAYSFQYSYNS